MISHFIIKKSSLLEAQIKTSQKIANAHSLGWQVMSRSEHFQDGKFIIVVWITPQRKDL